MATIMHLTRLLSRLFRRVPRQQDFPDASLLGLSTELLQKIAEKLELKNIQALRLVSKTANDKTLYIFATEFFDNQSIHITNLKSLQRAVAVANHPALGAEIRNITLFVDEPIHFKLDRYIFDVIYKGNQTKAIQAKGEDVKLLKGFFAALGVANRVEKIVMTDINKNDPEALQQDGFPTAHCPRPFHIVMEALYDSDLRPKFFEFAGKKWNIPTYNLAPMSFVHAAGSFRKLTSLSLNLRTDLNENNLDCWIFITHAIATCTRLTDLSVAIVRPPASNPTNPSLLADKITALTLFITCIHEQTIRNLQNLVLEGHLIELEHLVTFFARNPKLGYLKLKECVVIGLETQSQMGFFEPGRVVADLKKGIGKEVELEMDMATEGLTHLYNAAM